jgi:UDP-N-acetylmuramoyl-L-alanyl-D-glutamate--2,6-diaminopimelate ligase
MSAVAAPAPVALRDFCGGLATPPPGLLVEDISLDSRTVRRGGLFLACAGRRTHGLAALDDALARGARAVLWEPAPGVAAPGSAPGVWMAPIDGLGRHASALADRFFGEPSRSLTVTGITGTNGKTTVAWLLAQAQQGAYLGTLGAGLPPDRVTAGELTTADAVTVQRQLSAARAAGAACVAMEVSSHALDQDRVAAVRVRVAVFTNLTRDHLDYHGTMEAYGAAKARLFALPSVAARVINIDDAFGAALALRHAGQGALWLTCRTAAGREAAARCLAQDPRVVLIEGGPLERSARGLGFALAFAGAVDAVPGRAAVDGPGAAAPRLEAPLVGDFNADNLLAALGALLALGTPLAAALAALARVAPPPGRMEAIHADGRPLALVDYAHTPDALAKALQAARAHCAGRLIVVFGCGGDRDRGKRLQMAAVAAEFAAEVVITDDNPRTEPPEAIAADIAAGLPVGKPARIVHDRAAAIRGALAAAGAADAVLIAGKGHEDYQIVGAERRAFSDRAEALAALGLSPRVDAAAGARA